MIFFLNVKKIVEKYGGRFILFFGIIFLLHNYREHYESKKHFDFPLHSNYIKNVEETGKIEYGSSETLEIENTFIVNETLEREGELLSITGDMDGELDPLLSVFITNKFYYSNIDLNDPGSICEEKLNPLYPVLLRKLLYFMPKTVLYNGQKWSFSACKGDFLCNYSFRMKKKVPEISFFCSGDLGGHQIALTGEMIIDAKFSGIVSSRIETSVSAGEYVSNWVFRDKIKKK